MAQPDFTKNYINLALPERGAAICSVSDEFFAPARRMLSAAEPVFVPDRFDAHGKWMDGWESRRKRVAGHDHCVIRICPGVIQGIEIDTRHFTGNFPPAASLEACRVDLDPDDNTPWTELLPKSELAGDDRRFFTINDDKNWSHLRLHIYPDGGLARLRVYGSPEHAENQAEDWVDLASAEVGGSALLCNNMHFGVMGNLLSNTPVANMGDGWETRRRREAGNDWVILKLGRKGRICRVEVDTAFFKGNYPARCSLRGGTFGADEDSANGDIARVSLNWAEILPPVALGPDQLHLFVSQLVAVDDVTHVRLDIYPDGGIARLRLHGVPASCSAHD